MKGIILAAGLGTRLKPITDHTCKPLLPVADTPTIEYAIKHMVKIGIKEKDIAIIVNKQHTCKMCNYFKGRDVEIILQEEQLGTANALLAAKKWSKNSDIMVMLGDTIHIGSLVDARNYFVSNQTPLLFGLKDSKGLVALALVAPVIDTSKYGIIHYDDFGGVINIIEKPTFFLSNDALIGVYFFNKHIWNALEKTVSSSRGEYELTDTINLVIDWRQKVRVQKFVGKWYDTGTLESYLEANRMIDDHNCPDACSYHFNDNIRIENTKRGGWINIINSILLPNCLIVPNTQPDLPVYTIKNCILDGKIHLDSDIENSIIYGE